MKRTLLLLLVLVTGCEKSLEETMHGTKKEISDAVRKNGVITDTQAEILCRDRRSVRIRGLTSITDEQAEILSKVRQLDLPHLTSITDKQADILSKVGGLWLHSLTSITDVQAESLSKVFLLELPGLTSITDAQAESLSKFDHLELPGLTSITDEQVESLSKVGDLDLDGLTSITDEQVENLSKVAILSLNGLTSITDEQADNLSKGGTRRLAGLTSITDNQVASLSRLTFQPFLSGHSSRFQSAIHQRSRARIQDYKSENLQIRKEVNSKGTITDQQAERLSKAVYLSLPGLTSITDEQAETLSKVEHLSLDGLTSMTDQQARSLSKVEHLSLPGLTSITDEQAESLSKVGDLDLPGLTSMTDQQAESLSKVENLALDGLTSITDEQARSLSRNYVWSTRSVRELIDLHRNQEASTPVELPESATAIGMEFNLIPAGTFTMGAGDDAHEVTLTKPFKMGVHEVTQAQYEQVMGVNRSSFKGADNPVQKVSWTDAVEFCRILSELPAEKAAGHVYRLPSETEWEYACRAGTSTKYSFGDDESEFGTYGWYSDNSGKKTHPVGSKQPNAWGLYDMHGNVWEWCQDWYGDHPSGSVTDPGGAASGSHHVLRGGSWFDLAGVCRSSDRLMGWPSNRRDDFGFRVVLSQP